MGCRAISSSGSADQADKLASWRARKGAVEYGTVTVLAFNGDIAGRSVFLAEKKAKWISYVRNWIAGFSELAPVEEIQDGE